MQWILSTKSGFTFHAANKKKTAHWGRCAVRSRTKTRIPYSTNLRLVFQPRIFFNALSSLSILCAILFRHRQQFISLSDVSNSCCTLVDSFPQNALCIPGCLACTNLISLPLNLPGNTTLSTLMPYTPTLASSLRSYSCT